MTTPGSSARDQILERIRSGLGRRDAAAADEYRSISREYRQAADLEPEARVALFVDRLEHYQVGVFRAEAATLAGTIERTLTAREKRRLVIPSGLPRSWLPGGIEIVEDEGLSHADLDRVDGVLTGCTSAIAATGTIVLRHDAAEGRRALTLVPDYHLCVVFEHQIVQTVPEAIRALAAPAPPLVTTISGPSATADIEMTRIRGVHGPRTLDVILVA
jgi:L-lactate dehydrogenase complex protein LldG